MPASGSRPVVKDWENKDENVGANSLAVSLRKVFGILSGPAPLLMVMLESSFFIPAVVIDNGVMLLALGPWTQIEVVHWAALPSVVVGYVGLYEPWWVTVYTLYDTYLMTLWSHKYQG